MEIVDTWLGSTGGEDVLSAGQMALRTLIVFCFALVLVRIGSTRFMSRNSPLDLILAILLGSVLSRAITGQSPFFPTLAASAVLVALHSLFALLAAGTDFFGDWVKGSSSLLIENGERVPGALLRNRVGTGDLRAALRLHGHGEGSLDDIDTARLERNGEISLVMKGESARESADDDDDEEGDREAPP